MKELEKATTHYEEHEDTSFQIYCGIREAFIAGATWAFQNREVERILCAAIWYKELPLVQQFEVNVYPANIDRGLVFYGFRHPHAMYSMISITGKRSVTKEVGEYVQGFLTSKNRFVDRREAANLAYLAGQIPEPKEELYSEDLY